MSLYKGSTLIAGGRQCMPLLSFMWADHELNDISWLRADTFSWQSGTVYTAVYNHLSDDITGKSLQSETISGTTVQFYVADDGHKICPASEESNIAAIYAATGVAWYYILDTVNQRFKLPRINPDNEKLVKIINDTPVYAGAVNDVNANEDTTKWRIAGTSTGVASGRRLGTQSDNGTMLDSAGIGGTQSSNLTISNLHANITTESYYKGNKYLYFYVGQFTQTAIENTAGITAETLNSKVDKGHQVIDFQEPTAANNYTWYRKYADGWVEQGGYVDGNYSHTFSGTYMSSYIATTITLPVEMTNTNVNIYCNSTVGQVVASGNLSSSTTLELKLSSANFTASGVDVSWQVSGMAAN